MFNVIKMDLLRMKKGRAVYISLAIIAFMLIMTTYMGSLEMGADGTVALQEATNMQQVEEIQLGISFNMYGMELSMENLILTFLQSGFLILITGIFASVFACSEMSTGFIKNIAGVVKNRWSLVLSKNVVMFIFVLLEFIVVIAASLIGSKMFMPEISMSLSTSFWKIIGLQYLLHSAFAAVGLMFASLSQRKVVSIILTVCLSTGIGSIIVSYVDKLFEGTSFKVSNMLISSNVGKLFGNLTTEMIYQAIIVFLFAIIVYNVISGLVIQKRDIR